MNYFLTLQQYSIYFLQNDLNDNWYGKAVTGTHVIDGVTYTFDSTGALIQ